MRKILQIFQFICLSLIMLFSFENDVLSQGNMSNERFSIQVLKDTVQVRNGQFAFNSFTINNTSNQNLILGIRFTLPSGWNFVTVPNSSIEIRRGDFQTIPFRIAHARSVLGDVNYPITIYLKDPVTGKEEVKSFFVKINQNTNWTAHLLQSNLIIDEKDSLSKFQIKIQNKGNKRELFEINVKSDIKVSLPSEGTQLMLWPGRDTTLKVYVATRIRNNKSNNVYFFLKAKNETIMLNGSVYFTSETYVGHAKKFSYLPLDVEYFNINSFGGMKGYSFFNFSGSYHFNEHRSLNFLGRTNAFNSDYTINSKFYSLEYKTPKFMINIGNQNMFFNYQINGVGAKMSYQTTKRNTFEVYGLESQINDSQIAGFKHENTKKEDRIVGLNALFIKDNDLDKLIFFSVHNLEKKYSKTKLINVSGGYGFEKPDSSRLLKMGYMLGYRFESNMKFTKVMSILQYYDNNYPGILRGLRYGNHVLKFGKEHFPIYLFSESNSRQQYFTNDFDGEFQQTFSNQEYGLRMGFQNTKFNNTLSVSRLQQYQRNDKFGVLNGYKASLKIGIGASKFTQTTIINVMQTRINEVNNNRFNKSLDLNYQMRYRSFSIFANYSVGPNFYFDYLSFVSQNISPSLRNISVNYEFKNKSRTFYDRINLSNNKNPFMNKAFLMLRNEIAFEIPKLKSSASVFANVNIIEPTLGSSLNISLKKTLNIPVVFKQKYYSASFFLFKDKNNNDIFDKGEEPISDVSLQINGQMLKTNRKGMVFLKNVDAGQYYIDYRKIKNLKGWAVKNGGMDTLDLYHDMALGVPFKPSRMISGRVVFSVENSSKQVNETLNGILLVATNKKGEMFRTTTNDRGEFYLNLKEDLYNIQIPTNLLGEGYFIEKSILSVDLTQSQTTEVEFRIIQRKRSINIRKQ